MCIETPVTVSAGETLQSCSQEGEDRDPAGYQANIRLETAYQPDTQEFPSDILYIADPITPAINFLTS